MMGTRPVQLCQQFIHHIVDDTFLHLIYQRLTHGPGRVLELGTALHLIASILERLVLIVVHIMTHVPAVIRNPPLYRYD